MEGWIAAPWLSPGAPGRRRASRYPATPPFPAPLPALWLPDGPGGLACPLCLLHLPNDVALPQLLRIAHAGVLAALPHAVLLEIELVRRPHLRDLSCQVARPAEVEHRNCAAVAFAQHVCLVQLCRRKSAGRVIGHPRSFAADQLSVGTERRPYAPQPSPVSSPRVMAVAVIVRTIVLMC